MLEKLKNILAPLIGILELFGFRYPVKPYAKRVDRNLWRGSRIDEPDGYDFLQKQGIKMIINLCAEDPEMDRLGCLSYGMNYATFQVIDNTNPRISQIVQFIILVREKKNRPVYVHCEAGKGRTGVFVACYRISECRWSVERALKEAREYGLSLSSQEGFIRHFGAMQKQNG